MGCSFRAVIVVAETTAASDRESAVWTAQSAPAIASVPHTRRLHHGHAPTTLTHRSHNTGTPPKHRAAFAQTACGRRRGHWPHGLPSAGCWIADADRRVHLRGDPVVECPQVVADRRADDEPSRRVRIQAKLRSRRSPPPDWVWDGGPRWRTRRTRCTQRSWNGRRSAPCCSACGQRPGSRRSSWR